MKISKTHHRTKRGVVKKNPQPRNRWYKCGCLDSVGPHCWYLCEHHEDMVQREVNKYGREEE